MRPERAVHCNAAYGRPRNDPAAGRGTFRRRVAADRAGRARLLSFPGERTGHELKKWADASLRFFHWSPVLKHPLPLRVRLGHRTAPDHLRVVLRWSERRPASEVEPAEAMLDDLEHLAHAARAASEPPGQRVADSPTCG